MRSVLSMHYASSSSSKWFITDVPTQTHTRARFSRLVRKLKQTEECNESSMMSKHLYSSEGQPVHALLTAAFCILC